MKFVAIIRDVFIQQTADCLLVVDRPFITAAKSERTLSLVGSHQKMFRFYVVTSLFKLFLDQSVL